MSIIDGRKSVEEVAKDLREKRIGEIHINSTDGTSFEIIDYINAHNVTVKTSNNNILYECYYSNLKIGNVKDYLNPSIFGLGYYGDKKSMVREYPYLIWFRMMERCYSTSPTIRKKMSSYDKCSVSSEWYNYQNYKKWYYDNLWTNDIVLCVDKDILEKGNHIYGEKHCIFVPYKINNLFVKSNAVRGECPIGVNKTPNGRFRAYVNKEVDGKKKQINLGKYDDMMDAFYAYKEAKEDYIKQIADEYKSKYPSFPQELYDALYRYEVEESD